MRLLSGNGARCRTHDLPASGLCHTPHPAVPRLMLYSIVTSLVPPGDPTRTSLHEWTGDGQPVKRRPVSGSPLALDADPGPRDPPGRERRCPVSDFLNLRGRVVVVTGAASGMG